MKTKTNRLANLLLQRRNLKGLTLRQLEKETGISNGYLNLLEQGKVVEPSPNILSKLADFYGIEYSELLEAAGYVQRGPKQSQKQAGVAFNLSEPLTEDERDQLLEYLEFLRKKRKKS